MTFIPRVPLWCWALQGADHVFFSQPTHADLCKPPLLDADGRLLAVGDLTTLWLGDCPCVARCQDQVQIALANDQPYDLVTGAGLTPPIQCGQVASADPLGRYFCGYHMSTRWECAHCQAPLPHDAGGFCSPACQADSEALAAED